MDSLITISKDSTLVKGIIGGVLIAGASSALLYLTGNITGISGTYIINRFSKTTTKKKVAETLIMLIRSFLL